MSDPVAVAPAPAAASAGNASGHSGNSGESRVPQAAGARRGPRETTVSFFKDKVNPSAQRFFQYSQAYVYQSFERIKNEAKKQITSFQAKPKHYKRKAFLQLAVIGIVAAVLTTCMILRTNEGFTISTVYPSVAEVANPGSSRDLLLVLRVLAISPADMMMTLEGDIQSAPGFVDPLTGHVVNAFQIRVYGGVTTLLRFQKGNLFSQFNVQSRLTKGTYSDYPFDRYEVLSEISVSPLAPPGTVVNGTLVPDDPNAWPSSVIDFALRIDTRVVGGFAVRLPAADGSSFETDPALPLDPSSAIGYDGTQVGNKVVRMRLYRSALFTMYPVFIMIALWAVTLVAAWMSCLIVIWRSRRAELPMLIVYSGLIFFLPQFRNSAPLAPPVGCLMDWASYFFCVCIAILSFTGIFSVLITQPPQPPQPMFVVPNPTPVRSKTLESEAGLLQQVLAALLMQLPPPTPAGGAAVDVPPATPKAGDSSLPRGELSRGRPARPAAPAAPPLEFERSRGEGERSRTAGVAEDEELDFVTEEDTALPLFAIDQRRPGAFSDAEKARAAAARAPDLGRGSRPRVGHKPSRSMTIRPANGSDLGLASTLPAPRLPAPAPKGVHRKSKSMEMIDLTAQGVADPFPFGGGGVHGSTGRLDELVESGGAESQSQPGIGVGGDGHGLNDSMLSEAGRSDDPGHGDDGSDGGGEGEHHGHQRRASEASGGGGEVYGAGAIRYNGAGGGL